MVSEAACFYHRQQRKDRKRRKSLFLTFCVVIVSKCCRQIRFFLILLICTFHFLHLLMDSLCVFLCSFSLVMSPYAPILSSQASFLFQVSFCALLSFLTAFLVCVLFPFFFCWCLLFLQIFQPAPKLHLIFIFQQMSAFRK